MRKEDEYDKRGSNGEDDNLDVDNFAVIRRDSFYLRSIGMLLCC